MIFITRKDNTGGYVLPDSPETEEIAKELLKNKELFCGMPRPTPNKDITKEIT